MKTTKPLYNKKVTEPSDETIMNIKSFARNYVTCYSSTLKKNINWLESQFTKLAGANISVNISNLFTVYLVKKAKGGLFYQSILSLMSFLLLSIEKALTVFLTDL